MHKNQDTYAQATPVASGTAPSREEAGWRRGRPVEDPDKTKRWGFISAKPSEYLIHMRRGEVLAGSSGQGATCFKRPRDAVAVVPTSLQRLTFTADQVTLEKVGVLVRGLAVFRIADPVLAFRVLNFSYPERAQEKLRQTLGEMFVGATRRLVANLSVDDCLQKRKAALADELLQEIAPVVGGHGRFDDTTDAGWGVVLDTIEIQEVRVQSAQLFDDMQAPYRAELERNASLARAARDKETRLKAARDQEEVATAELLRDRNTARARAEAETEERTRWLEAAAERERERAAQAEEQQRAAEDKIALQAKLDEAAHTKALRDLARREQEARVDLIAAAGRAQLTVAEKLPELAAAVGQRFGDIKLTQIGTGATGLPVTPMVEAVGAVLSLAQDTLDRLRPDAPDDEAQPTEV